MTVWPNVRLSWRWAVDPGDALGVLIFRGEKYSIISAPDASAGPSRVLRGEGKKRVAVYLVPGESDRGKEESDSDLQAHFLGFFFP